MKCLSKFFFSVLEYVSLLYIPMRQYNVSGCRTLPSYRIMRDYGAVGSELAFGESRRRRVRFRLPIEARNCVAVGHGSVSA